MADSSEKENIDTKETILNEEAIVEPDVSAILPSSVADLIDQKDKEEGGHDRGRRSGGRKGGKRRQREDRPREQKEFDEVVLQVDRVSRMMKGGRRLSFRASVVIGDRKSRVGFGIGKANEVQLAVQKAVRAARKGLITVALKDNRTISHRVNLKFKAAQILIMPASEGTGIIAGGTIRSIMVLAGVKDCLSKNIGASNKINVAKATIKALESFNAKN
ncbi:MAG: 30S ribosomal protein S5 [Patescibacteria group bacterium]|nr:30S ribosomal protein S5 [Patescibacteria group bacterium]